MRSATAANDAALGGAVDGADGSPVLRARDVDVVLDGNHILHSASLEVQPGEIHVLIGPNGAGKTTLANAITGHVAIAGGSVELHGHALRGSVVHRARAGVGRKFQVPRVFERLTAKDNLTVARRRSAKKSAIELELDDTTLSTAAEELSHGQRQRLELDMVLSQKPAVAVLDEPTAGMTRSEREDLARVLRAAAGQQTFLIVEHDMDFVGTVADTVSFMQDGQVIVTASFKEVSEHPAVRSAYLGGGTERLAADRRAPAAARSDAAVETAGSLKVEGLVVYHGQVAAVRNVSFELSRGGALGVLGRNGAGKTTLLSAVAGLLRTDGRIELDGVDVERRPAWWRGRHGMALVPQGRQLFTDLTVAENLRLPECGVRGEGREFDVHQLFPAIRRLMSRRAGLLSGGEQQQVAIARALLRRPTMLMLDEPTEGLAPVIVDEIAAVLEHLIAEGLTIILAEQHRALVERLCSTVLVLRAGESVASGPLEPGVIDTHYRAL